jgi:mannose-1-phosphate guanylyltransferase
MFVWTAEAVFEELQRHIPEHVEHLSEAVGVMDTEAWEEALRAGFRALKRISVDFAVMEKARDVRCVCGSFSWRDVGGWLAVQDFLPPDEDGNRCRGFVRVLDAGDNLVFCEQPEETLAMVGVRDLVVVRAGSRTLIAPKDRLEDVKRLVEALMAEPGS